MLPLKRDTRLPFRSNETTLPLSAVPARCRVFCLADAGAATASAAIRATGRTLRFILTPSGCVGPSTVDDSRCGAIAATLPQHQRDRFGAPKPSRATTRGLSKRGEWASQD